MLDSHPLHRLVHREGRVEDLPQGLDRLARLNNVLLASAVQQRHAADRSLVWKAAVAKMPALESSHRLILGHLILSDATDTLLPPKETAALLAALAPQIPTLSAPAMDLLRQFDPSFVGDLALTPRYFFMCAVGVAVADLPPPLRFAPLKALAAEVARMSTVQPHHGFREDILEPILAATTALAPQERAHVLGSLVDQVPSLSVPHLAQSAVCESIWLNIKDHPLPGIQGLRLQARLMTVELSLLPRLLPSRLLRMVQQRVLRLMTPEQLVLLDADVGERLMQVRESALRAGGGPAGMPQWGAQPGAGPFPMPLPFAPLLQVPAGVEGPAGMLQWVAQAEAAAFQMAGPLQDPAAQ